MGAAGFIDEARATVLFAPNLAWRDEPLRSRSRTASACRSWWRTTPTPARGPRSGSARRAATRTSCSSRSAPASGPGSCWTAGSTAAGGAWPASRGTTGWCPTAGCAGAATAAAGSSTRAAAPWWPRPASSPGVRPAAAVRLLQLAGGSPEGITGPQITQAAREGDPAALRCFEIVGGWLGQGLADLAAILDPGCFVIGGGVSDAGELLLGPARAAFEKALTGGLPPARGRRSSWPSSGPTRGSWRRRPRRAGRRPLLDQAGTSETRPSRPRPRRRGRSRRAAGRPSGPRASRTRPRTRPPRRTRPSSAPPSPAAWRAAGSRGPPNSATQAPLVTGSSRGSGGGAGGTKCSSSSPAGGSGAGAAGRTMRAWGGAGITPGTGPAQSLRGVWAVSGSSVAGAGGWSGPARIAGRVRRDAGGMPARGPGPAGVAGEPGTAADAALVLGSRGTGGPGVPGAAAGRWQVLPGRPGRRAVGCRGAVLGDQVAPGGLLVAGLTRHRFCPPPLIPAPARLWARTNSRLPAKISSASLSRVATW